MHLSKLKLHSTPIKWVASQYSLSQLTLPNPSLPHTSLMRGQYKATSLHLLREKQPGPLSLESHSQSSLVHIISSVLGSNLACHLGNHLLLLDQILPRLELQTFSTQSHLPEAIVSSFCPFWLLCMPTLSNIMLLAQTAAQHILAGTLLLHHRGYAGASLGWDDQVHRCRLPPFVVVPGIFPRVLPQWVIGMVHFWVVPYSLKTLVWNCILETN